MKYLSSVVLIVVLFCLSACHNPPQYQPRVPTKKSYTAPQPADKGQTYKETSKKRGVVKKKIKQELPSRIKDMNTEELVKAKEYNISLGYLDLAIKNLERLIILVDDALALKEYRLELADLYFELGEFEKSGKLYAQYIEHYPGSTQREYVEYKTILCHFYNTLTMDRDQTNTKETIALTSNYLEKRDIFPSFVTDVEQIQHASYLKLAQSEAEVVQFYARRHKFKAAENRLAYIKNNYLPHVQEFEPELLNLEIQLADAQGYKQIAESKRIELAVRFPAENTVQIAHKAGTDYVTKF